MPGTTLRAGQHWLYRSPYDFEPLPHAREQPVELLVTELDPAGEELTDAGLVDPTDPRQLGLGGVSLEHHLAEVRLRGGVTGQPHERNLERWCSLVDNGDLTGIKRVLTGLARDSIEMREVSPMGDLLSHDERSDVLTQTS